MRVFYIIFIFLCVPYLSKAQSAGPFSAAHAYEQQGAYLDAAVEYEHFIFQSDNVQENTLALFAKARAYKLAGEYNSAVQTLNRIKPYLLDSAQLVEYYSQKLLCQYLDAQFENAEQTLTEMNLTLPSLAHENLLLQTLLLNELGKYDQAKELAIRYAQTQPDSTALITAIEKAYTHTPHLKKMKLARFLALFPGLGHLYAGYTGEAVVAFALNGGLAAFGVYQAWYGFYLTAWLGAGGILSSTYTGNLHRAEYLVEKRNYHKQKRFNDSVRELLLSK